MNIMFITGGGVLVSVSVYLSPSAQERNIGVADYGSEERRMNQVADEVYRILVYHKVRVWRNRSEWTLERIVNDSNSKKPDLHLAIHSNAGGGTGSEVFAYSITSKGAKAATDIYTEIARLTPGVDRGIKYSKELYELRKTDAAAVLVEVGFHDVRKEVDWIVNNIKNIAQALSIGVLQYLNIRFDKASVE